VVACESAREIVDLTIERLNREKTMEVLRKTMATLTGGPAPSPCFYPRRRFPARGIASSEGGAQRTEHHRLCVWGRTPAFPAAPGHGRNRFGPGAAKRRALGIDTFREFRRVLSLVEANPTRSSVTRWVPPISAASWMPSACLPIGISPRSGTWGTWAPYRCRSPPPSPRNAISASR